MIHNREMIQLLPKTIRGLECLNSQPLQGFFMLSKNKWTTSNFQRLLIPLQNGTATFFESDCQLNPI